MSVLTEQLHQAAVMESFAKSECISAAPSMIGDEALAITSFLLGYLILRAVRSRMPPAIAHNITEAPGASLTIPAQPVAEKDGIAPEVAHHASASCSAGRRGCLCGDRCSEATDTSVLCFNITTDMAALQEPGGTLIEAEPSHHVATT
mmetsp:Transcript_26829/g.61866  ORF Transcript_26829/g.61866 Transcript_26829/m.61866 type:complete len:148 (+) Transcript_26829:89-532(+)